MSQKSLTCIKKLPRLITWGALEVGRHLDLLHAQNNAHSVIHFMRQPALPPLEEILVHPDFELVRFQNPPCLSLPFFFTHRYTSYCVKWVCMRTLILYKFFGKKSNLKKVCVIAVTHTSYIYVSYDL